jgi:hypothetical protein
MKFNLSSSNSEISAENLLNNFLKTKTENIYSLRDYHSK